MIHNIFNLNNNASFVVIDGVSISFEHSVGRDEFLSKFNVPSAETTMQISYEPSRNLYHSTDDQFNLTVVDPDGVDNHAQFSFIKNNFDAIKSWFEFKYEESENSGVEVPVLGE
jgi:hypothetical protein